MPRLELITEIATTPEVCFDVARDLDLHVRSMSQSREEAIAGRTSGLIELGEEVTWRGRHLGCVHEHTARITAFDYPRHFRDEMIRGRFSSFVHDHYFEPSPTGTRMTDVLVFEAPLGVIGRAANTLFLSRYLRRLLLSRNRVIKQEAEATQPHGQAT